MTSGLILPQPVDDELVHGYLGRVRILNGLTSQASVLDRLRLENRHESDRRATPTLVYLARALTISEEALAERHTMAPLFNAVTRIDAHRPEWTPAQTALRRFGNAMSKTHEIAPRSCPVCAIEDRHTYGVAIWRRRDHIPGIDFCALHRVELVVADSPEAFSSPPPLTLPPRSVDPHPLLARYLSVCESLLSQPSSHHLRDLRPRVLEHVHLHGLANAKSGRSLDPVLPGPWTFLRWGDLPHSNRQMLTHRAINFLESATSFDATAYVVALCLVFEDAGAAIRFHSQPMPSARRFAEGIPHRDFWNQQRAALESTQYKEHPITQWPFNYPTILPGFWLGNGRSLPFKSARDTDLSPHKELTSSTAG